MTFLKNTLGSNRGGGPQDGGTWASVFRNQFNIRSQNYSSPPLIFSSSQSTHTPSLTMSNSLSLASTHPSTLSNISHSTTYLISYVMDLKDTSNVLCKNYTDLVQTCTKWKPLSLMVILSCQKFRSRTLESFYTRPFLTESIQPVRNF